MDADVDVVVDVVRAFGCICVDDVEVDGHIPVQMWTWMLRLVFDVGVFVCVDEESCEWWTW